MDADYLKKSVGSVLSTGIAETVLMRPDDPVEYLAQYLLKSVDDNKAAKELANEVAEATKEAESAKQAADLAAAEAATKAAAEQVQTEKEDKRLSKLLEVATTSDQVFSSVVNYARSRIGASGFVAITDLPETVLPKKELPAPPAPQEGEEGYVAPEEGAEPAEPAEPPPPPPQEGEEGYEPPPPKFSPQLLTYITATSNDESILLGKSLDRPAGAGEEDEAPPAPKDGEGVCFGAVDEFLAGNSKLQHTPSVVQNRAVKFWYLPRMGGFVCAPFANAAGEVVGVLGFDTLGLERTFTADECAMIEGLAATVGTTLDRIEESLSDEYHALNDVVGPAYEAAAAGVDLAALEAGEDPMATAEAKASIPLGVLSTLTGDNLRYIETRRTCKPALLSTLKAVWSLVSPTDELKSWDWAAVKSATNHGQLLWKDELFSTIAGFDVMSADAAAWAAADEYAAEVGEGADELKGHSLVGWLLLQWLTAASALQKLKAEKAAADAAAEAEAAAAAAEGEAETPTE